MRPTHPKSALQRGVTLIELIVAMVLMAVIVGATVYFIYPVRQGVDLTVRAELTDAADNALQRIGREVRGALPNSVRATTVGTLSLVELLPVRTAGRYRVDAGGASSGTDCTGGATEDRLAFGASDTCFKSIGAIPSATAIAAGDFVVLNNYGSGFIGQDAYEAAASNRALITASADEGSRQRIAFIGATFDASLHDSPGRRFFIVNGSAGTGLPEPVTFECDTAQRTLTRRWGYAMVATQPTAFGVGHSSALLASNVESCQFDYLTNVAPQVGLLTLRLTLAKAVSSGAMESVTLYHAVHVSNVP